MIYWLTGTAGSAARRYREFGSGGHFAALQAPGLLVDDVRAFLGGLR